MASRCSTNCLARCGATTSKVRSTTPSPCQPKVTKPSSTTRTTRCSAARKKPRNNAHNLAANRHIGFTPWFVAGLDPWGPQPTDLVPSGTRTVCGTFGFSSLMPGRSPGREALDSKLPGQRLASAEPSLDSVALKPARLTPIGISSACLGPRFAETTILGSRQRLLPPDAVSITAAENPARFTGRAGDFLHQLFQHRVSEAL